MKLSTLIQQFRIGQIAETEIPANVFTDVVGTDEFYGHAHGNDSVKCFIYLGKLYVLDVHYRYLCTVDSSCSGEECFCNRAYLKCVSWPTMLEFRRDFYTKYVEDWQDNIYESIDLIEDMEIKDE